ncbi:MAG TPA: hypothetical protein VM869_08650 [Enhygromyxa sp.]|nr:hypothetical protein [Enhygromyxa sp.]
MTVLADPEALLGDLAHSPSSNELRERAALALSERGRHREAVEVLAALTNLTAHDGPTLPCLCRRCLDPERVEADADGIRFTRRFAVAYGRVLYYWAPIDIADSPGLQRSVRARLHRRLEGRDK